MRNLLFVVSAILLTSGCKSLTDPMDGAYTGYAVQPFTKASLATTTDLIPAVVAETGAGMELYRACTGLDYQPYPKRQPATPPTEGQCKALRNAMVAVIMLSSEEACVAHRRSIYGKEATFNIAAGTFTSFFSGWAAVAPGAHTKAVLAALALFANSERSLVNEMVYKSTIVPAVDRKILALREEHAENIALHFKEDVSAYPMTMAMRDAINFHYSCSFMVGLEKVIAEGTQESPRQKLTRLNRTLMSLQDQIRAIPANGRTDDIAYPGLKERSDAVGREIATLEKQ